MDGDPKIETLEAAAEIKISVVPDDGSLIGSTLPNTHYRIEELIGSGAFGVVYKAMHLHLKVPVAIKMLDMKRMPEKEDLLRFKQEAQTYAQLSHPNVVRLFDFGVTGDGAPYMVLEFVEGFTLREWMKKRGQLENREAILIAKQIASALHQAHQKGIVHRDIKPENIFLVDLGARRFHVKVSDFGIAKITGNEDQSLTATGDTLGTPLYMSPEQLQGMKVYGRSDFYSLGCMLYEMMTGRAPFSGDSSIELSQKHMSESFPKDYPEIVWPSLKKIVEVCTKKNPEHRWENAEALEEAFGAALEHVDAREITQLSEITSTSKYRRKMLAMNASVMVVAMIFMMWVMWNTMKMLDEIKHQQPTSRSTTTPR